MRKICASHRHSTKSTVILLFTLRDKCRFPNDHHHKYHGCSVCVRARAYEQQAHLIIMKYANRIR